MHTCEGYVLYYHVINSNQQTECKNTMSQARCSTPPPPPKIAARFELLNVHVLVAMVRCQPSACIVEHRESNAPLKLDHNSTASTSDPGMYVMHACAFHKVTNFK